MRSGFSFLFLIVFLFCFSCSERKVNKSEQVLEGQRKTRLPDSLNRKWKKGIDITASGSQPVNWTLEADFDREILFLANDGHQLRLLPILDKSADGSQTTFNIKTGDSLLTIVMGNSACLNGRQNAASKSVSVLLGKINYTGCGQYLYNNQLNDVWLLDKINDVKISKSDYAKQIPSIDLRIDNGTVSGNDGCSNFSGMITVQGSRIAFSKIARGSSCEKTRVSDIFATHVFNNLVDYRLSNNTLVLYLSDDSKLSFIRKQF